MKRNRFITAVLSLCIAASGIPPAAFTASAEIELPALHAAPALSNSGLRANADIDLEYAKIGDLPASYDMRKEGMVPAVRNQGLYGTCWAHAAIGCLEVEEILRNPNVDYSEWYTSHYGYQGPTGYPATNIAEGDTFLNEGGRISQSIGMFTNWVGPALEKDYPYGGDSPDPNKTMEELRQESQLHVTGYHYFVPWFDYNENDNTRKLPSVLKQALCNGHAIYFDMYEYLDSRAMNTETNAYYVPDNAADYLSEAELEDIGSHAMMIVGYDDNYPAENFTFKPAHNGAWLVRNSWGINHHDDGYFWLSYDCNHINNYLYFETTDAASRDTLFEHDDFGGNGGFAFDDGGDTSACAANVFTAEKDTYITEVMVNCCAEGDTCEITLYTDLQDELNPTSGTASAVTTTTLTHIGYQTVPLEKPVFVQAGKSFSVSAKFSGYYDYHIPLEVASEYDDDGEYSSGRGTATINAYNAFVAYTEEMIKRDFVPLESFVSKDGGIWYDCYAMSEHHGYDCRILTGNVCLKAIGVDAGKVLFSDYHDTLPCGAQITLRSTDGNPVYYSLNGGAYAEYTQPIEYLGGDITVSAYSQEGIVSTQSYSQQKAGLTSLLIHQGWTVCSPNLSEGTRIKASMSLFGDDPIEITPIGRGNITINGKQAYSGEKSPITLDDVENYITITVECENLLPQTYELTIINLDKAPIPNGVWIGAKGYPIDDGIPPEERQSYDYRFVPYVFEMKDGKAQFRNLTTNEYESFTYKMGENCICEFTNGDKTETFYQSLCYEDLNNIDSALGASLYLNTVTGDDGSEFFTGEFESDSFICISEGSFADVTVYTDSEIINAMTNYYANRTGTTPDSAEVTTNGYQPGYVEISLYQGEKLLDTYSVDRYGSGYRWNGEQFSYADFLTEPQPIETTTTAESTTTTTATTTVTTGTSATDSSVSGTTTVTTAASTAATTKESSTTATETTSASTEYFAPVSKLCEMAQIDYYKKNGTLPATAESKTTADGSLEITLKDADGKTLDTYKINPVTGIGTASDGSAVNLPQTGNNAPGTAAAAAGAFLLIGAGLFMAAKSGVFRRKKTADN